MLYPVPELNICFVHLKLSCHKVLEGDLDFLKKLKCGTLFFKIQKYYNVKKKPSLFPFINIE